MVIGRLANERGAATAVAIIVLALLLTMALAFLTVGAFEPRISRNHADIVRARYVAEAGIEAGFNAVVATVDLSTLLTGAACAAGGGAVLAGLPALPAGEGTFAVRLRNDCAAGDNLITGVAIEGSATTDSNRIVILESTGTVNGSTRTIQVAVRRNQLVFPGAVNVPGLQADTYVNNVNFDIDGRDYGCTSDCDNRANWTVTTNPLKWGIATQNGTQQNIAPTTYEQRVENGFNSGTKQANVKGKSEVTGSYTTGLNTIQADPSLTPSLMHDFLNLIANQPSTTVLQSTLACPMRLDGNALDPATPQLTNGCGADQPLDLGTRDNPKLVYFRGELDPTSGFTGLRLNSGTI